MKKESVINYLILLAVTIIWSYNMQLISQFGEILLERQYFFSSFRFTEISSNEYLVNELKPVLE